MLKNLSLVFLYHKWLVICLLLGNSAHGDLIRKDQTEKKSIWRKLEARVLELDLKARATLFDLELTPGLELQSKLKIEIESARYNPDIYLRADSLEFRASLNAGDIIENFGKVPFGISEGMSAVLVRPFSHKRDALHDFISPAEFFRKLPKDCKNAREHLKVGEFVSVPITASLQVGPRWNFADYMNISGLNAGIEAKFIVSGNFIIQMLKVRPDVVRLMFFSTEQTNKLGQVNLRPTLDVFGVSALDRVLRRAINLEGVNLTLFSLRETLIFHADYTFDLSDAAACEAFNDIVSSPFELSQYKELLKFKMTNPKVHLLNNIGSFDKAESISQSENPKVFRHFLGIAHYDSMQRGVNISIPLIKYQAEVASFETYLSYLDRNNQLQNFFYPGRSKNLSRRIGKSNFEFRENTEEIFFALLETKDPHFSLEGDYLPDSWDHVFSDSNDLRKFIGFNYFYSDHFLDNYEAVMLYSLISAHFPEEIKERLSPIDWGRVPGSSQFRLRGAIGINQMGMQALRETTKEQYKSAIKMALKRWDNATLKLVENKKGIFPFRTFRRGLSRANAWSAQTIKKLKSEMIIPLRDSVDDLACTLYQVFSQPNLSAREKAKMAQNIPSNKAFGMIGFGFLLDLLPENERDSYLTFLFDIKIKDHPDYLWQGGEESDLELIRRVTAVNGHLNASDYQSRLDYIYQDKN